MTPDDKKKYIDELKDRARASADRADKSLLELAAKSAKLRTDVKNLHSSLTEQLTRQAD